MQIRWHCITIYLFSDTCTGLDIATNTVAFATLLYLFATRKTRVHVVLNLRLGFALTDTNNLKGLTVISKEKEHYLWIQRHNLLKLDIIKNKPTILWLPTGSPCLSILKHTKVNLSLSKNGYPCSKLSYNALQTLRHWVRHVCLWIVSLLFDFGTKNVHLATIFYHLVAKWRLDIFFNFEPCCTWTIRMKSQEWRTINQHCTYNSQYCATYKYLCSCTLIIVQITNQ